MTTFRQTALRSAAPMALVALLIRFATVVFRERIPAVWLRHVPVVLLAVTVLLDVTQAATFKAKVVRLAQQIKQHQEQAAQLRRNAEQMSGPETFAKAAKLQRQAIQADKAAGRLHDEQERVQQSWSFRAAPLAKRVASAAFVYAFWGRAVLAVDGRLLWPFGRLACTPHCSGFGAGEIAAAPWVALCQASASLFAKAVT